MRSASNVMRWRGHAKMAAVVLVMVLQACSTPPGGAQRQPAAATPAQPAPAAQPATGGAAYNREVIRSHLIAATQRDELYESFTGMKRTDPMFAATKESVGALYRDPLILDWMIDQIGNDRNDFSRKYAQIVVEGFARADDDTAMKLMHPIGSALGRLDAEQCKTYVAQSRNASSSASFMALLRWMQPAEIGEFMDGLRLAMRAGIQGKPLRPVASPEQVASMWKDLPPGISSIVPPPGASPCEASRFTMLVVEASSGERRSYLLSIMLASAGLTAQRDMKDRAAAGTKEPAPAPAPRTAPASPKQTDFKHGSQT